MAVVGAILLFFITGTTINMMGVIGIVMLVGIAVNNSIILVDRINQLKTDRPLDRRDRAGRPATYPPDHHDYADHHSGFVANDVQLR